MDVVRKVVVDKILGLSQAERAFRPWWDYLQDLIIYCMVVLGLVVTIIADGSDMSMNCEFMPNCSTEHQYRQHHHRHHHHQQQHQWHQSPDGWPCSHQKAAINIVNESSPYYLWVQEVCLRVQHGLFIHYFAYTILLMTLAILIIERVFKCIFKAGMELDTFYKVLVVESLEKDFEEAGRDENFDIDQCAYSDSQMYQPAIQLAQTYSKKSSYFFSYLLKCLVHLMLAGLLLSWSIVAYLKFVKHHFVHCSLRTVHFRCTGHPRNFFMITLYILIPFLVLLICSCLYNTVWLIFPQLRTFDRVILKYRRELHASQEGPLGKVCKLYYKNKDLRLVLDLLAEQSGIATCIKFLAHVDKDFRVNCEPCQLKLIKNKGLSSSTVEFKDSFAIRRTFNGIDHVHCSYTVLVVPPVPSCPLTTIKIEKEKQDHTMLFQKPKLRRIDFNGLDEGTEYHIHVVTCINGHAITKTILTVSPESSDSITLQRKVLSAFVERTQFFPWIPAPSKALLSIKNVPLDI